MTSSKDTASCSSDICTQKGGWCRRLIRWKGPFRSCSSLRLARAEQRASFFLSSWLIPLFPLSTHYPRLSQSKTLLRQQCHHPCSLFAVPHRRCWYRTSAAVRGELGENRSLREGGARRGLIQQRCSSYNDEVSVFISLQFLPFPLPSFPLLEKPGQLDDGDTASYSVSKSLLRERV
jgi:hypothetical protein